jgi:DNA repair exonuclease SbcCD ATPase subunit
MRPLRLYIENFTCHDKSFVDFTQFSAALIVGKVENNDLFSNGVGKTSIFKAIEYILFNQSDANLEKVIRDDTDGCEIVFDFAIGDQEYRLVRKRTRKGSTDVSLFQRNGVDGGENDVYHSITEVPYTDKKDIKKYWKDLSGSRAGDTEKELAKLIKINPKSFRSTVHFLQNDFGGLPTATPEKRKGILKEALNLAVYTKLEKIAKEKASALSKEIDKNKVLLEGLGNPSKDLLELAGQLVEAEKTITDKTSSLAEINAELEQYNTKISDLTTAHSTLESKFASLLAREKTATAEKSRLEISVKEYQSKRSNVTKVAKELILEIESLKADQGKLAGIDYSQIDILSEKKSALKEQVTTHNITIKNNLEKIEENKVPLPTGSACRSCRKPMTEKDRKEHKAHLAKEMEELQHIITETKRSIAALNAEVLGYDQNINSLNLSKQQLEGINTRITSKSKEYADKKSLHEEYSTLLDKFVNELTLKGEELEAIVSELQNSSLEEAKAIQQQIDAEKKNVAIIMAKISTLNKEITHYNSIKAVVQHNIDQKTKDKLKGEELKKAIVDLEAKFATYPSVLQAFSTTGIPNLIIQNVLDDLQVEANNLLSQLKPGLQLSFFVEKTVEKTGDLADTLDINYQINGKERYYEQLSGAQKLAVTFSLKLGLSFLLQKMIGTDIKLLLLDEIDQSLDKASVDAFADIVKFFQKDFTILIITHNDRLKDKFSHAILVEQDINMVSRARVVSSW